MKITITLFLIQMASMATLLASEELLFEFIAVVILTLSSYAEGYYDNRQQTNINAKN